MKRKAGAAAAERDERIVAEAGPYKWIRKTDVSDDYPERGLYARYGSVWAAEEAAIVKASAAILRVLNRIARARGRIVKEKGETS